MSNHTGCILAAGLLAGALLAGCAHKPTLVGKWQETKALPQGGSVKTEVTFAEDGKETITRQAASQGRQLNLATTGTYTVSSTTLTQKIDSISMNGQAMPVPANISKTQAMQFQLDGDKLTLSGQGTPTQTLTRE